MIHDEARHELTVIIDHRFSQRHPLPSLAGRCGPVMTEWKKRMESEEFDYIIVGAGSAGCVLANRLSADPKIAEKGAAGLLLPVLTGEKLG